MKDSCAIAPKVFRRNGIRIEAVDSKLFADIKKVVKDDKTAWDMWAFSKTAEFKKRYPNVEYDELGEVTFQSYLKETGLEEAYKKQRSREVAEKDFGIEQPFDTYAEAVRKVNQINAEKGKFIALISEEGTKHRVYLEPRDPIILGKARQQSYNYALTEELLNVLRSLGFDVAFADNPEYDGIFDPKNATFNDGLLTVIRIAKGEEGERALPEEFAHLIIEGLQGHVLVQRLLNSLTDEDVKEILGLTYNRYAKKYNNDSLKLKKEAAGKLLGEFIRKEGTLYSSGIQQKKSLLARIWEWAKNLLKKLTKDDVNRTKARAYEKIADVYNLAGSMELGNIIDRKAILSADELYALNKNFNTIAKLANKVKTLRAEEIREIESKTLSGKATKEEYEKATAIRDLANSEIIEEKIESVVKWLQETAEEEDSFIEHFRRLCENEETDNFISEAHMHRGISRFTQKVRKLCDHRETTLRQLALANEDSDTIALLGIPESRATEIADMANICLKKMDSLKNTVQNMSCNLLLQESKKVYNENKTVTFGERVGEVLALSEIVDHATCDINWVDRYLAALNEASDPLLALVDSIVKGQQYERDMETGEWYKKIAVWDKALRDAGYSSDFIHEKKNGKNTGRLLSIYDWDSYLEEFEKIKSKLKQQLDSGIINDIEYGKQIRRWQLSDKVNGETRLIKVYVDPKVDMQYRIDGKAQDDAPYEMVPNPKVFNKKAKVIDNLAPAQREYYYNVINAKRTMMAKIPHKGQHIYSAIFIPKGLGQNVLEGNTKGIVSALKDKLLSSVASRFEDLGLGQVVDFQEDIENVLNNNTDPSNAAKVILQLLADGIDENIYIHVQESEIRRIIKKNQKDIKKATADIIQLIANKNFFVLETDFAHHTIKKIPIYYTRRLKDMDMLSPDFSGNLLAYCAMAINYEKMDEIADILECGKQAIRARKVSKSLGNGTAHYTISTLGEVFKGQVEEAGTTNIEERYSDYIDNVLYDIGKDPDEEGWLIDLFPNEKMKVSMTKTLDAIRNYTGLLTLGMNVFSSVSNVAVGKVQQWIEAVGGEDFNVADYTKAQWQYYTMLPSYLAEINSNVKTSKLGLLIEMFDPMGSYFDELRHQRFKNKATASIIEDMSTLGYLGMNAGEHYLHCTTMLAILNHIKLYDKTGKAISLFDALEPKKGNDGITRLVLKEGLSYKRDKIDYSGETYKDAKDILKSRNPNYGKPLKDENGKIIQESIPLVQGTKEYNTFIYKKRRVIRKVNDTLNGAYSTADVYAIHRKVIGRLIMQFKRWMPAHYMRRFARGHYDNDLERWKEGYYRTVGRVMMNLGKDLIKGNLKLKTLNSLSSHEIHNIRRAVTEITAYFILGFLCRFGGRVKDKDRNWLDKMFLYQIHRMRLEVGGSMPNKQMFSDFFNLIREPVPSTDNFEKFINVLQVWNWLDEIETGKYQGWTEVEKDIYELAPFLKKVKQSRDFDDSMFSYFRSYQDLDK